MPEDIAAAFGHANKDNSVHVVVLTGAGRGFCGGYDVKAWAEEPGTNPVYQDMPWDPMIDYNFMSRCTQNFMSIWRFDGMARHSPEGIWFKQRAEEVGFKQAVAERDSGDPIPGSKK